MASSSLKVPLLGAGVLLVAGVAMWLVFGSDEAAVRPDVAPIAARPGSSAEPVFSAPAESDRMSSAQPLEAAPQATAPAALAQAATAAAPAAAAAAGQGPSVGLSGRVIDGSGRPVQDAQVHFVGEPVPMMVRRDHGPGEAASKPLPVVTTDRDGRFRLQAEVPPARERGDFPGLPGMEPQLVVRHPQFASLTQELGTLEPGPQDVGDLQLESGAWILGRVVDSMQRPVAGATVRARNEGDSARRGPGLSFLGGLAESLDAATSGPDGRFEVRGLRAGAAALTAQKSGLRLAGKGDLELEERMPLNVGDVVLETGAAIAGVVLDESGVPLKDVEVSVSSMARIMVNRIEDLPRQQIGQEFGQRAVTDAQGRFEVGGLAGGTYTVHVTAAGCADLRREDVPAGTQNLTLRPVRLGSLLLTLLDSADGHPVQAARVKATPAGGEAGWWRPGEDLTVLEGAQAVAAAAVKDAPEGLYLVQGAGLEGTQLVLAAEGYATQEIDGPPVASGALERFTVRLVPAAVVAGRVLDEQKQPIAGALVELVADKQEDGDTFSFEGGRAEMRRSMRIGHGPPDAEALSAERLTARSDAEGVFEVRGASAGDWKLHARADGYVNGPEQRLTLAEGQSQRDLSLVLGRAGVLAGLVTETDGTPAGDVEVTVSPAAARAAAPGDDDPEGQVRRRFGRMFGGPDATGERRTRSHADGSYSIDGLEAGDWVAQLGSGPRRGQSMGGAVFFTLDGGGEGSTAAPTFPARIVAGQETRLDFVRPRRGVVSGRVLAGGAPVPDVSVTMRRTGGMPFGGDRSPTDERGEFRFEDVEAGSYDLTAMAPGAALEKRATVTLEAGQDQRMDLVFAGSTISGRVVDEQTGNGVEGVQLTVVPAVTASASGPTSESYSFALVTSDGGPGPGGGMSMTIDGGPPSGARTDGKGNFELKFVEPGRYTVEAEGAGYMLVTEGPFEVAEGRNKDDLKLTVQRGAIVEGRVRSGADGQALDKVPVRLRGSQDEQMNVTQDGGRFRFEGLQPGDYTVEVLGSGFMSEAIASEEVKLDPGETRSVDLTTKT